MINKSCRKSILYIPVLAILCCLTGVFYIVNYPRRQAVIVMALMAALFIMAAFAKKKGKDIICVAVFFLLGISFLIKADYVIYTPCWVRQHDVIGFGAGFGQAAFIEYFYEKIRLIDFDPRQYWGFFQPPLHHILAGLWLRLMDAVYPNYGWACDNVQLLTLFYSCMVSYISYLIFVKIGLHNKGLVLATALVALHPCFILLAGSINNDILCILLQLIAMYYFICWNEELEKDNSSNRLLMVYIILCALTLGLSMMTKLSGILIAPAIGLVMLIRLIKSPKLIFQYAIFGIISVPLGIWSPVRNYIKFGVPLNYTPEVGEPLTSHSVLSRIFDIRTQTPFTNLIDSGSTFDEFNFFLGMIKTSLFGEYTFADIKFATFFGWFLLISGSVLGCLFLYAIVSFALNKEIKQYIKIFVITYVVATMVFYVNLCFSIPNFSSLDFRYIAHLIILGAICFGFYVNQNKSSEIIERIVYITTIVFCISSLMLYIVAGTISWR